MDSIPEGVKRCQACHKYKTLDAFHRNTSNKDGRQGQCKECKALYHKSTYCSDSPKAIKASERQKQNRAHFNAYKRRYYAENAEKARSWSKAYNQANPEKRKIWQQQRRARLASAEGKFTLDEWLNLLASSQNLCHWCGCLIEGIAHADHRIPLSKGGSNGIENIVPACPSCNSAKSAKMPWEFNGRLL